MEAKWQGKTRQIFRGLFRQVRKPKRQTEVKNPEPHIKRSFINYKS